MTSTSTESEQIEKVNSQNDVADRKNDSDSMNDVEIVAAAPTKPGLFDKSLTPFYRASSISILKVWCIMILCTFLVTSINFGSFFKREDKLVNLSVSIYMDQDESVGSISPLISNAIRESIVEPEISILAGWNIANSTELTDKYPDMSFQDAINKIVYERRVWAAMVVSPNATYRLYEALRTNDVSFNVTELVTVYIASSRDVATVEGYVETAVLELEEAFISKVAQNVLLPLFNNLTTEEQTALMGSPLMFTQLGINLVDLLPFLHLIVEAPLNVGLILLIIVSFFQFNFFLPIHGGFAAKLRTSHYILYRIFIGQLSYLVMGFTFTCILASFTVDFNTSVGKGGFMATFCTLYMTMACVGGANENAALICFATYPPVLGFWLLFWVMSNISPTFSALALCPTFYRYGYAMPIHNCAEVLKVLLLNNWKGELGRNFGLLVAWWAIFVAILPFSLKFNAKRLAMKQQPPKK